MKRSHRACSINRSGGFGFVKLEGKLRHAESLFILLQILGGIPAVFIQVISDSQWVQHQQNPYHISSLSAGSVCSNVCSQSYKSGVVSGGFQGLFHLIPKYNHLSQSFFSPTEIPISIDMESIPQNFSQLYTLWLIPWESGKGDLISVMALTISSGCLGR